MIKQTNACFNCGETTTKTIYGFHICPKCEAKIGLMSDATLEKHLAQNSKFKKIAQDKLAILEKDYIRKKIKLLDILERV